MTDHPTEHLAGADLAVLIASRICHDLISPVGAISNGLELLEMVPGVGREEAGLIRQSADAATASLKFMRIAFGAPGFAEVMPQAEAARILVGYLNQGRRTARWDAAGGGISRSDAQILFLTALSLADTAPVGGALTVEALDCEPLTMSLAVRSPRIQALAPLADPTPRDAHRFLWNALVDGRQAEVLWDITPAEEIGLGEGYARVTLSAR